MLETEQWLDISREQQIWLCLLAKVMLKTERLDI